VLEIKQNIEANRAHGAWEIMGRAMLLTNYRFGAVDIQNKAIDFAKTPVVVLPSAKYLQQSVQEKLVDYVKKGGSLLVYGELPLYDLEGKSCSILVDSLGVTYKHNRQSSSHYHLSVCAHGWAASRPEVRTDHAQTFALLAGQALFRVYGTDEVCGFEVNIGKGKVIAFTMNYRCDLALFQTALERLGAAPQLSHDYSHHGIFMTSTRNVNKERFIHLINLDGFDKQFHVMDRGVPLFEGKLLTLTSREGLMLPLNLQLERMVIKYATAEIHGIHRNRIEFRLTQAEDVIKIETQRAVLPSADFSVQRQGNQVLITSKKHSKVDDYLEVRFQ